MGKTGRSVTRSYLAALDLLIPVEASISGTISTENEQALDPQRRIIRDRYNKAMTFLSSVDKDTHKSKLSTYVEKQSAWSSEMERYTTAQAQQAKIAREQHQLISDQRQAYNEWLQAHARDVGWHSVHEGERHILTTAIVQSGYSSALHGLGRSRL